MAEAYPFRFIKIFGRWEDIHSEAQSLPRCDVVHFRPIEAVELLYQSCFEVSVSFVSVRIIAVPVEKVTHAVKLSRR